jgi:LysR family hca operon transcriptional activator
MDERHLRYFVAVAENLSFTRAAERLHTAQPSLSAQVRNLETAIGTPLFRRDTRHVELTEAGDVFLQEAKTILRYMHHAVIRARQTARTAAGHITIGSIVGAEGRILSRVLSALRIRCPGIEVTLRSLSSPQQIEALQNEEINVGFLRGPVDDPAIVTEVVAHDSVLAILPCDHPMAKLRRVPIAALAKEQLVQVSRAEAPAIHDITNEIAQRAGVQFHTTIETDNVLATVNAVAASLGFSLLPDYISGVLPASVVAKPLDIDPPPLVDLLVAYRKTDSLPALTCLLSLLREKK